mmetsp:Transcript_33275/g.103731  ORF Transcript_33275/g.103731 Transcript_33275/m.103731 type:complete len:216 (+) Transcript_33275:564-1211(+)
MVTVYRRARCSSQSKPASPNLLIHLALRSATPGKDSSFQQSSKKSHAELWNGCQLSSITLGNAISLSLAHLGSMRSITRAYSTYSQMRALWKVHWAPCSTSRSKGGDLARQVHSSPPHSLNQKSTSQPRPRQSERSSITTGAFSCAGARRARGTSAHSAALGNLRTSVCSARCRQKERYSGAALLMPHSASTCRMCDRRAHVRLRSGPAFFSGHS